MRRSPELQRWEKTSQIFKWETAFILIRFSPKSIPGEPVRSADFQNIFSSPRRGRITPSMLYQKRFWTAADPDIAFNVTIKF